MNGSHVLRGSLVGVLGLSVLLSWSSTSLAMESEAQACPEEPLLQLAAAEPDLSSTGETAPPADDVQERAVPRMGPSGPMMDGMRQDLPGGIIDGNRLIPKPGYRVEIQPNNQAMLKPAGGGTGVKVNCQCSGGLGGGCVLESVASGVVCTPGGFSKCKGTCRLVNASSAMSGQRMQ